MKTRYFSLTSLALAVAFLTMPLIAAEKPVEGPIGAFLGEPKFEMQHLFTGARLPNVVVATDGTVLATWGATGGGGDWWDKGVQVRRSRDGGKTWSKPITIANPGWQGGGLTVDDMRPDDLCGIDLASGRQTSGSHKATSEVNMHLGVCALGANMKPAFCRCLIVEDAAKSLVAAAVVGTPQILAAAQEADLTSQSGPRHRIKMMEQQ